MIEREHTGQLDHIPVLAEESIDALVHRNDGWYVDGTLGRGGHSELICKRLDGGRLIGIDRDPVARAMARDRLAAYPEVTIVEGTFGNMASLVHDTGISQVSGVLLDLGVSSMQLDDPDRGFSFRFNGPLDMRMGSDADQTAEEIVNTGSEDRLTEIFRLYGEEPQAGKIAKDICRTRNSRRIQTTEDLAEVIGNRGRGRPEKTLARVFQALRIAVNGELKQLEDGLAQAVEVLEPGGRLVVISYHSLEDRIVKLFMREESRDCICPHDTPVCICNHTARLKQITRRIIRPCSEETARNPRARSARLRVAERARTAA